MSKSTPTNSAVQSSRPVQAESFADDLSPAGDRAQRKRRFGRARLEKAFAGLPVALAFLTSCNTLWNDFVSDDTQQVLGNMFIRELKNLPFAFTTSVWTFASNDISATAQPYYRPLFNVLFTLNYALFGTASPVGWHLVNILIHAIVSLFVFVVCKELTQSKRLALITASLFAVHPVHSESVAWISGVTDPLMSLFLLPAFYFYLVYRRSGRPHHFALTLLLFLCALWSKETAIAFPEIVAYCELFHFRDTRRIGRLAVFAALFVVTVGLYLLTRHQAFGAFVGSDELRYPLGAALKTIPLAVVKYLWLVSVPVGYSYQHYTDFVTSISNWQFLAPLGFLAVLAGAIIGSRSPLLKFAGGWFLIWLLPALAGIVSFDPSYLVQERYLYLPAMGFCLAVALGLEWLAPRLKFAPPARVGTALLALLLLGYGATYVWYNTKWHDTIKVFQRVVAADPNSASGHAALAMVYSSAGRPKEAEQESRKALELDPQCISAYSNLSYFSRQGGKLDESIAYLEQAIANAPQNPITRTQLATVYLNLGLLYAQRKDYEQAETKLKESNALWSRTIGYYYTGQYYFNLGRYDEALPYYETVLQRLPKNYAPIRLSLGALYEQAGQIDRAITFYSQYLELAPENAPDREQVVRRLSQLRTAQNPPAKK